MTLSVLQAADSDDRDVDVVSALIHVWYLVTYNYVGQTVRFSSWTCLPSPMQCHHPVTDIFNCHLTVQWFNVMVVTLVTSTKWLHTGPS